MAASIGTTARLSHTMGSLRGAVAVACAGTLVLGLGSFTAVYSSITTPSISAISPTTPIQFGGHVYLAATTVAHGTE
jgi:hypothetical protein